jgi:hypothetical protein
MEGMATTSPHLATSSFANPGRSDRFQRRAAVGLVIVVVVVGAAWKGGDVLTLLGDAAARLREMPPGLAVLAIALFAVTSICIITTWWNVLRAAYPSESLPFRFVLGAHAGRDALSSVTPSGTANLAMFGLLRFAIPQARIAAFVAAWAVQAVAFTVVAAVTYVVVVLVHPAAVNGVADSPARLERLFTEQPVVAIAAAAVAVAGAVALAGAGRRWVGDVRRQIAQGGAILRSPSRYLILVAAPTLLATVCRWGSTGVLMAAFDIPVTPTTLALVIASHTFAGSVRVTPAGLGTVQALDVALLHGYASADAATAYSLAQSALSTGFHVAFGLIVMTWALGWNDTRRWFRHSGEISAEVRAARDAERELPKAELDAGGAYGPAMRGD